MSKISIPRPTGKQIRDLHAKLFLQWSPRFKIDEEFRDLVHQKNKIETLPESEERNMTPVEIRCLDVSTPILTRDLKWVPVGELRTEDHIIGFSESSVGSEPKYSFRLFEEAIITYASPSVVDGYVIMLENDEVLRCTGEHQFLITQPGKKATHWRRVDELYNEITNRKIRGMPPQFFLPKYFDTWTQNNSREAGFLAGAFDADGTLIYPSPSRPGDVQVKFSQYDNELLEHVKTCLNKLSFAWGEYIEKHPKKSARGRIHCITIRGGLTETMRFLGTIRPPRLLTRWSKFNISQRKLMTNTRVQIKDIKRDKIEVMELSSSSKTYISSGYGSHNSGRSGGIIEHANGLLMARPDFHAESPSLITTDTREAEQLEKVVANTFERELVLNDFWPAVGRDILVYGRAFLKSMLLQTVWTMQAGYPIRTEKETSKQYLEKIRKWKETEGKFPFIIQHIPVLSILPLLDNNDNVLATIEVKYVTAKILAEEMNSTTVQELLARRLLKWYDELPVVEYIDLEWVAYALAGTEPRDRARAEPLHQGNRKYQLLRTWRHGLGKHPVVCIPGIRTELQDFESHYKGFLADAKDALLEYDILLSRLATMIHAYYLPSYIWTILEPSSKFSGRDRPTLTVNLGGVTVLMGDEKLDTLPIPQHLPDATMLLQQCDDIIQRATLEDVLFGRVQGAAPAYQVSLRINIAKSKLSPLTQHMAIGVTEVFDRFLRGIEQLGEAILIGGERITVKMAKTYRGRLTASIQPKSPVDRSQDIGTANLALQFGLPWDWIVENILDIEDPATLRLMNEIQELEQLPPVKEKLMQDALEQLEALVEEEEFEESGEIDLSALPPEFEEAMKGLLAGGEGEEGGEELPPLGAKPPPEGGLSRGPFSPGAAPQTLAPRGLGVPNTPTNVPGTPLVGEEEAIV